MIHWTLILVVTTHTGVAITQVPDFKSQPTCLSAGIIAAKEALPDIMGGEITYSCVEIK
jgi:hypothetical protein